MANVLTGDVCELIPTTTKQDLYGLAGIWQGAEWRSSLRRGPLDGPKMARICTKWPAFVVGEGWTTTSRTWVTRRQILAIFGPQLAESKSELRHWTPCQLCKTVFVGLVENWRGNFTDVPCQMEWKMDGAPYWSILRCVLIGRKRWQNVVAHPTWENRCSCLLHRARADIRRRAGRSQEFARHG